MKLPEEQRIEIDIEESNEGKGRFWWNGGNVSEEIKCGLNERSKAGSLSGCADCDKDKSAADKESGSCHILLQAEVVESKTVFFYLRHFQSKCLHG